LGSHDPSRRSGLSACTKPAAGFQSSTQGASVGCTLADTRFQLTGRERVATSRGVSVLGEMRRISMDRGTGAVPGTNECGRILREVKALGGLVAGAISER